MLMFMYVSRIVWNRLRPSHSPVLFATRDDSRKGCCLFNACRYQYSFDFRYKMFCGFLFRFGGVLSGKRIVAVLKVAGL